MKEIFYKTIYFWLSKCWGKNLSPISMVSVISVFTELRRSTVPRLLHHPVLEEESILNVPNRLWPQCQHFYVSSWHHKWKLSYDFSSLFDGWHGRSEGIWQTLHFSWWLEQDQSVKQILNYTAHNMMMIALNQKICDHQNWP